MNIPKSNVLVHAAWVAVVSLVFALASGSANAAETSKSASSAKAAAQATPSPIAAPSAAASGEIADIKAAMAALKARLDLIESQQEETARQTFGVIEDSKKKEAAAAAAARTNNSVRIGTPGTNVRLYALLEATLSGASNTVASGAPRIGMTTPWFSGSRWGIDASQRLSAPPAAGEATAPNKLEMIAKLESEFEIPSGNMDTPGVLFNRDAWVGMQSKTFGKLTMGRQNALPRDVAGIWGDPYGGSAVSTAEGGFTNTNNFKQLIFYASGGNSAGGQGDTRYDAAFVWKKLSDSGWFTALAYNFGDQNGPGGPNGSGPIAGAQFNKGATVAGAIGYNAKQFHTSAFYTSSNVLETVAGNIGGANVGHQAQSLGIGANWDGGPFRINAGYIKYSADQGKFGRRADDAWTVSTKITPNKTVDYELGVQEFYARTAAVNARGFILRPFQDAALNGKGVSSGNRFTVYGSYIVHPVPNLDLYVAADDLLTSAGYLDSRAGGFRHMMEYVTGARYRF